MSRASFAARTRHPRLVRAAWWLAQAVFAAAAGAPILANRAPLVVSRPDGFEFPFLTTLDAADVRWIGAFVIYLLLRTIARWGTSRQRWRSAGWLLVLTSGVLAGAASMTETSSRDHWRQWREWRADGVPDGWACWAPIRWDPSELDRELLDAVSPSLTHPLGTDSAGRDLAARLVHASRVSLQVGIVATLVALGIGVVVGALAGFYGGWVDLLLSRILEVVQCFPDLFLILAVLAYFPPSIVLVTALIGFLSWPGVARLTRAEFQRLRSAEFVLSARAVGASPLRVLFVHMLPHAAGPILVFASLSMAGAIVTESSLSFLGLGIPPPEPSWGQSLHEGRNSLARAPWITFFPGLMIFLTVTSYNVLGEGLRDAWDPRQTKGSP